MYMDELLGPKKSLGQHWLTDSRTLESIANLADIQSTDTILEIGPGLGYLSEVLLRQAENVVAVELDSSLAESMNKTFAKQSKLSVVNQDIRRYDLTKLPKSYKVVANIPYYLTSYLIRLFSQTANPPSIAVLLVQREVAERLAAPPGKLSLLGVTAQIYWDISLGLIVPPSMFTPPPKVNSQVVKLSRKPTTNLPAGREREFFKTVKIGFSQKRKTLANSLTAGFRLSKTDVNDLIIASGLAVQVRPQQLSIDDWFKLAANIQKLLGK